ncbi:MAG: PEP-utilizing enzyme [Anaerolineae bacterium]
MHSRSDGTAPHKNPWNASLSVDYLWSSVNFGEAVTEVMTPLTWSVLQFTLDDWTFLPGIPTVGNIGGRPYLNISVFATLFYALGRGREGLLSSLESTLYMRLPVDLTIPTIPTSPGTVLRGLLCSARVQIKQHRGAAIAPAYAASSAAWFRGMRTAMQSCRTASSLHDLWHSEVQPQVKTGVWCTLGSVSASSTYTLKLRRRLAALVGPEDADTLIANLSGEDVPLASLGPIAGLAKMARGEMSKDAYLELYGHRGPHEFELSVPRPAEDPTWVEEELDRIRHSLFNVEALMAERRHAFESAWDELQSRNPGQAGGLARRIAESARRARLRERVRSAYVRDRWAVRLFALRAGELTGLGERIFFLTLDEVLDLLSGHGTTEAPVAERMEMYDRYRALPPYPPIVRGPFDPFAWAADSNRPTDVFNARAPQPTDRGSAIVVGSPGSAGVTEGVVRILHLPEARDGLQPGEILVATQTDIAWTPLFPQAAAVVTDIGAPLSHAAIVARELGIPAVVGCGNATAALNTGDRVRVDGGRGTVEILNAEHPQEV